MTASHRIKELLKGGLVLLALAAGVLIWIGAINAARDRACDRLDAVRLSHLEPGHDTRGPDSIYVIGVGPGPPPSQLDAYLEALVEMEKAGCDVEDQLLREGSG